jgi:hypothetical protein
VKTVTAADRPDLLDPAWERTRDTLPEYNNHGDVLDVYWGRLTEERPEFQFHLIDDHDQVLARARSIPLRWDGPIETRSAPWSSWFRATSRAAASGSRDGGDRSRGRPGVWMCHAF